MIDQAYSEALKQIAQLTKERDEAQAKCAEMRDCLQPSASCSCDRCEKARRALSDQCGTGWISPEKAGRLREALESIMQLIDNGFLVRSTALDHRPDWTVAQVRLVKVLAQANQALEACK